MYIHLVTKTEYSILASTLSPKDIPQLAKKLGMKFAAITDTATLSGIPDFFSACTEIGIHPVFGLRVNVAFASQIIPFVLLAKSNTGYKKLFQLTHFVGRTKTSVPSTLLTDTAKDCIGIVPVTDDREMMTHDFSHAKLLFSEDSFFCTCALPNPLLCDTIRYAAKRLTVPFVATAPVRFKDASEESVYTYLAKVYAKRFGRDLYAGYAFSDIERIQLAYTEEECDLTEKIASRCRCSLEKDTAVFPVPKEYVNPEDDLKKLCHAKLEKCVPEKKRATYEKRLETELDVINKKGLAGYFLLVADCVRFAHEEGIPVGPGRGSAVGALVSYLSGITEIDPVAENLLFERFLTLERTELPDIDLDFCERRRNEIVEYFEMSYGREHVAKIITFGKIKARALLLEMLKFNALPEKFENEIRMLPETATLSDISAHKIWKTLPDTAKKIVRVLTGKIRNTSIHASGIIVSGKEISEIIPVFRENGLRITGYSADTLENFGLVKLDILSLRTLTCMHLAKKIIENLGKEYPEKLPYDDEETWKLLREGKTQNVFQLDGDGQRKYLRELKPTEMRDLVAFSALYRPGPMKLSMHKHYIARKNGNETPNYFGLEKELAPILEETFGVICYQEQIMQIAEKIAGFTQGDADLFRQAVMKNNSKLLEKYEPMFYEGAAKKNIDPEKTKTLFATLKESAAFTFAKAHAVAYAKIIFETAFLAANYNTEYACALMNLDPKKGAGYSFVRPDINESFAEDTPLDHGKIREGFSRIVGLKESAVREIIRKRKDGAFASMYDFLVRIDPNRLAKQDLEILLRAGVFDCFKGIWSRRGLYIATIDTYLDLARKRKDKITRKFSERIENEAFGMPYKPTESIDLFKEWSDDELRKNEKLAFGNYITGHPLQNIPQKMRSTLKRELLLAKFEMYSSDWILVHIASFKQLSAKTTGKRYAILAIEDMSLNDTVKAFVWDETLRKYEADILKIQYNDNAVCEIRGYFRDTFESGFTITEIRRLPEIEDLGDVSCTFHFDTKEWNAYFSEPDKKYIPKHFFPIAVEHDGKKMYLKD